MDGNQRTTGTVEVSKQLLIKLNVVSTNLNALIGLIDRPLRILEQLQRTVLEDHSAIKEAIVNSLKESAEELAALRSWIRAQLLGDDELAAFISFCRQADVASLFVGDTPSAQFDKAIGDVQRLFLRIVHRSLTAFFEQQRL